MSDRTNKVTVFYSWQSTLPRETNNDAIRQAVRLVFSELEEIYTDTRFVLDEANRDTSGSNDIAADILRKISQADIFISDISLITVNSSGEERHTPNPNVLIELGFAAATIGWNRTLMVFNKKFGKIEDLPFDIKGRTILDYKVTNGTDGNGKGQLKAELKAAVKNIIDKSPLRPHELAELTPEQKKRKNDIAKVRWIMQSINIPLFDAFITDMPRLLDGKILHYWESYNGIFQSSIFHIYDPIALKHLHAVHNHWGKILSRAHQYRGSEQQNDDRYFFGPKGRFLNTPEQKDLEFLEKERTILSKSMKNLLAYLRESYIEIDLDETSRIAHKEFIDFHKA